MPAPPVARFKYPQDARAEFIAYRWYFPTKALPWASANGQRFHRWVIHMKGGEPGALAFGGKLLQALSPSPLGRPGLVVAAPCSKAYTYWPEFPLHRLARAYAEILGGAVAIPVKRTCNVPSAVVDPKMRDPATQLLTMQLPKDRPNDAVQIVILDDVTTSGATLEASRRLLREAYPSAWITTFAFGKTCNTGSTAFPDEPSFPS